MQARERGAGKVWGVDSHKYAGGWGGGSGKGTKAAATMQPRMLPCIRQAGEAIRAHRGPARAHP
eukprot:24375-Chlamydomonas_euryale.AAC.1